MNIDEQMFGLRKTRARHGVAAQSTWDGRRGRWFVVRRRVDRRLYPVLTIKEVTFLTLGDWQRLAQEMPPDTPVIFRYDGQQIMRNEDYCDGLRAVPSRMWEGRSGWRSCVLVELGERF